MPNFRGFSDGKTRLTPVPAQFFHELLPEIDDLNELKLTMYVFWRLDQMEGVFRGLRRSDFLEDAGWMQALGHTPAAAEAALDEALERAVVRGTLLRAAYSQEDETAAIYLLNSPKGRAALQALGRGFWQPGVESQAAVELGYDRPNIFRLYEDHIGPLTPLISDALGEAEDSYPTAWIEEAFRIAVENNKRSWRYIAAILQRWQEEGRDDRKDRRDSEKDRRRYVEGEFSDFIEH